MRGESTQRGYYFSESIGKAGGTAEFLANERNLRGIALLSWLRLWLVGLFRNIATHRSDRGVVGQIVLAASRHIRILADGTADR